MYNRYLELKNLYKEYLIFIKKKNRYITYNEDRNIYNYLKIKKFKYLKGYNINYIILDNLEIEDIRYFLDNKYNEYYLKMKLTNIVSYITERRNINEKG